MSRDGRQDFDFLHGLWRVRNRRLRERLAGCDDWDEFEARVETRPVLGGMGNREHFDSDWDGGYHGMALRLYDRDADQWRIWWASDRSPLLEAPVVGGFEGDIGDFRARFEHEGRSVLCRYRWTRIDADHAQWDQAYSLDEGGTWEANWIMQFLREGTAA